MLHERASCAVDVDAFVITSRVVFYFTIARYDFQRQMDQLQQKVLDVVYCVRV